MDKPRNLYEVRTMGDNVYHIYAASGEQAKRIYCKQRGIQPSDCWCGVRALSARKLKPEEVKAWEDDAPARRMTSLYIEGMMEIYAKAYAERVQAAANN